MAHQVILDDSFENIGKVKEAIRDQIGAIVKALESDPLFEPDPQDYWIERDADNRTCACRRFEGWDDWQMEWLYRYSPRTAYFEPEITAVVVLLTREPLQLQPTRSGKTKRP